MVRIFVTSNPISTILMSVYAKRTGSADARDILCIDHYVKKKALIELINESATLHNWNRILDFSTHVENDFNLKPTFREKMMRRIKFLPLIRTFYAIMLKRHLGKKAVFLAGKIKNKLAENDIVIKEGEPVELYELTQTELNAGMEYLFDKAPVYYMEHGTVDYIYVVQKPRKSGYICIFKDNYEAYLAKRNISFPLYQCLNQAEFTNGFMVSAPGLRKGLEQISATSSKRYILFLMDALEKFNPDPNFWTDYIDRCLKEVPDSKAYTFLIKPHPTQSNEVVELTQAYFKKCGLDFIMLNKPEYANLSVETIYVNYQDRIDYVFSTFSAAIFYLSFFYGERAKFYYSYHFVGRYIKNAPPQYRHSYEELRELIDEVFTNKHCISLN